MPSLARRAGTDLSASSGGTLDPPSFDSRPFETRVLPALVDSAILLAECGVSPEFSLDRLTQSDDQMIRSVSVTILSGLLAASNLAAQVSPTPQVGVDQEIRQVIRQRLDASARGDAGGWARFVADERLCATSTKAAIQQEIKARPSISQYR
jgi:hypothetical protein